MGADGIPRVPRGALWGAAAVIALSVGLAAAARQAPRAAPPPVREAVALRFEDRADGAIVVRAAATGREVSVVKAQADGFVRGVLRGIYRTRKLESLGQGAPLVLGRGADGRLTLEDPQTGHRVDLSSFGPTNAAAFEGLLAAAR